MYVLENWDQPSASDDEANFRHEEDFTEEGH